MIERAYSGGWSVLIQRDGEFVDDDLGKFGTAKKAREAVEQFIANYVEEIDQEEAGADDGTEERDKDEAMLTDEALLTFAWQVLEDLRRASEGGSRLLLIEAFPGQWGAAFTDPFVHLRTFPWARAEKAEEYATMLWGYLHGDEHLEVTTFAKAEAERAEAEEAA